MKIEFGQLKRIKIRKAIEPKLFLYGTLGLNSYVLAVDEEK